MKNYTREELEEIIKLHGMWLRGEDGGKRADLSDSSLDRASLDGASLDRASLDGASLSFAFVACVTGKKLYRVANGIGESGRSLTLLAEGKEKDWLWWIGCFNGKNEKALRKEIETSHANSEKARKTMYLAIDYLKAIAKENK